MKSEAPLWIGGALLWTGFAGMLTLVMHPILAIIACIFAGIFWWVGREEYIDPLERKRK